MKKFFENMVGDVKDVWVMIFLWTFLGLPWIGVGLSLAVFLLIT